MNNPYEILGVANDASDEELKRAYKEIARKYHPSNYEDNPLTDIAQSRMKELDNAYDMIMSERRSGALNNEGAYTQTHDGTSYYNGPTQYPDVRKCIDNGRLDDAITILEGIPTEVRTAEWFYLKGNIQQKRGWIEEAYNNYKIALDMDPYNQEYKNSVKEFNCCGRKRQEYYGRGKNARKSSGSCGLCNVCMGLICLDTCCGCLGNDCC